MINSSFNPILAQLDLPLSEHSLVNDLPHPKYSVPWHFLSKHKPIANRSNFEKVVGCLQALDYFLEFEDIERAEKLLLLDLDEETSYQLMVPENNHLKIHTQIYSWGYSSKAIEIYQKILDRPNCQHRHTWLVNLGHCYRNLADYQIAQQYYEESLTTAQRNNSSEQMIVSYGALMSAYGSRGEFDEAIRIGEIGWSTAQESGAVPLDILRPLRSSLGIAYAYRFERDEQIADLEIAEQHFEFALKIAQETNNKQAQYLELGRLINFSGIKKDFERAINYGQQMLAMEIDNPLEKSTALGNLGRAYYERGQELQNQEDDCQGTEFFKKGLECLLESLTISEKIGEISNQVWMHCNIAEAYLQQHQIAQAQEHLRSAETKIIGLGDRWLESKLLELQGNFKTVQ
jgi:tetratricopeptide (TPR) repeat protein